MQTYSKHMKYELNNLLKACKQKKRKKIKPAHAHIKTEENKREEDALMTTCINVNALDANSYTPLKKEQKVKTYMYKKLYQLTNEN